MIRVTLNRCPDEFALYTWNGDGALSILRIRHIRDFRVMPFHNGIRLVRQGTEVKLLSIACGDDRYLLLLDYDVYRSRWHLERFGVVGIRILEILLQERDGICARVLLQNALSFL